MKKSVLVFGVISGIIVSALMLTSIYIAYGQEEFEGNMVLGFAMMIAALSFVFVGVRNYRNNYHGGYISFWNAFKLAMGIAFVACTIYVASWMVMYYTLMPDWMDVYAGFVMRNAEKSGANTAELAAAKAELDFYREQYQSPLGIIWLTYVEILVVAIPVALLSAAILQRKPKATMP
ncbi:MAG: DUF4199 domain-containing protein [Flavobacterium sp.]